MKARSLVRFRLESAGVRLGFDEGDRTLGQLAHGAFHFRVAGVADQHDLAAAAKMDFRLAVHLGDEWAGGVEVKEVPPGRGRRHRLGDAVGGENHRLPGLRNFVEVLHEDRALRLEAVDDIAIMDDLMPHVDRRAIFGERQLDDLDSPVHPGAEAARAAEEDLEGRLSAHAVE